MKNAYQKKLFPIFFSALLSFGSLLNAHEEEKKETTDQLSVMFTPPQGWRLADKKTLPKHVLVMVVGKGTKDYPPSMNLGYDNFQGSLKEYFKIIKEINASQGCQLKDLGMIPTQAGPASLSQFDEKTSWGEVRQMHAIVLKDGVAYILTASALKEEFANYYQEFFKSMQTLRFGTMPASSIQ